MLNEEQQKDIEHRKKDFLHDYEELCLKYSMEHVAGPQLMQMGPTIWGITMVSTVRDTKFLPTQSPLPANDL